MSKTFLQERFGFQPSSKRILALTISIGLLIIIIGTALAAHGNAELPGSNFEIDDDANLVNDDGSPSIDWEDVGSYTADLPTGQDDNSYKGGTKEDTECPNETTGSIPNNKSDLLTFHVYEEPGDPGFVNIAWSRVSDPSGTTLMDFEFNQSTTPCPQGPNVVRTEGDLLIEYAIDQGGARADISGRFWDATAGEWGPAIDLDTGTACDGNPCAVGTINQTAIDAADSFGLGAKEPRTFGEAQIDLSLIFEANKCTSFGSAMLKSRSSDSFTSQLKDFIAPVPVDLQNCGNVIIRKQTLPDEDPNSTSFGFAKVFATDPTTDTTFSLTDDGVKDFQDDVLFGTGYTVDETSVGSGYVFDSIDCSASIGVTPSISGSEVTFDIDADTDVLDCTYYNQALADLTYVKDAERSGVDFDYTTSGDPISPTFSLADGESVSFTGLALGTYTATETLPSGWNLVSQDCDNGDTADAVTLEAGDVVTCTFINEIERGAIEIVKTRKHAADGPGDHPHEGVNFEIRDDNDNLVATTVTDANGEACVDDLPVSVLDGDYTVTEVLPIGYSNDGALSQDVTVIESTCADGNGVVASFSNTPLTNVTVSVDSQVDGGTASTISCTDSNGNVYPDPGPASTGANGDGSLTVNDLLPTDPTVTLTCVITIDP